MQYAYYSRHHEGVMGHEHLHKLLEMADAEGYSGKIMFLASIGSEWIECGTYNAWTRTFVPAGVYKAL